MDKYDASQRYYGDVYRAWGEDIDFAFPLAKGSRGEAEPHNVPLVSGVACGDEGKPPIHLDYAGFDLFACLRRG